MASPELPGLEEGGAVHYLGFVVAIREDAGWNLVGGIGTIGRGSAPRGVAWLMVTST